MPSFKNTALIFLEVWFFQHFTIFSSKQYDIITDLICIIENVNISETKKDTVESRNLMPPLISRTPVFLNQFGFPLEVRETGIPLYFKKKTPFFLILKGLSNKQKLFFTSYAV